MATTVAFSNYKGGVAKTATCLSLGACLAEMGRSVLLVDLDPQANLTLSLGLKPDEQRCTANDAFFGVRSLASVSRESHVSGLDIIPANQGLALIDKVLYGRTGYEFHLRNRMRAMDRIYDAVLIDCPSHFGTLTLNALTAVDLLVVPVQCDFYAAHALRQTTQLVRGVRQRTNPRLSYRVLVTMYDRRNRICRAVLEEMRRDLDVVLFDTIIDVDTRLRESPVFGQPITLYAPETRSARQYRALAEELMAGVSSGLEREEIGGSGRRAPAGSPDPNPIETYPN